MDKKKYIMAIDQGTTGTTVILFNEEAKICGRAYAPVEQYYPQPGWVEHDAEDIWIGVVKAVKKTLDDLKLNLEDLAALGITNQRESVVIWDKNTGKPVAPVIVWQCRRTTLRCEELRAAKKGEFITARTGLVIDAYFSATKLEWYLANIPGLKERTRNGEILAGTIDTWLIWKLTGGKTYATDYSNASRTMLYNIYKKCWDEELLSLFNIPAPILPEVRPSSGDYGMASFPGLTGEVPICGVAGDQQAALFGQTCFTPGMVKTTYGTGAFLLMNTGTEGVPSNNQLLTTIAWGIDDKIEYALEGSVFIAGAGIQWLRDELGLIKDAAETSDIAASIADNGGVYLVPAFAGLGAPYWDMRARGMLIGMTRGTNRAHIIRAALEAIAYQVKDVIDAMRQDAGHELAEMRVDGGAAANDFLLQFQANILGTTVTRPTITETTALGAALLAGLGAGYWSNREKLKNIWQPQQLFMPNLNEINRQKLYHEWQRAVVRSRNWIME